jgi:hypothetical protein
MTVKIPTVIFRVMVLCSLVGGYQRIRGRQHLHLHDRNDRGLLDYDTVYFGG